MATLLPPAEAFLLLNDRPILFLSKHEEIRDDIRALCESKVGKAAICAIRETLLTKAQTLSINFERTVTTGTAYEEGEGDWVIDYGNAPSLHVFSIVDGLLQLRHLSRQEILLHELFHVFHGMINRIQYIERKKLVYRACREPLEGVFQQPKPFWTNHEEKKTIGKMNGFREELGLPPRYDHRGVHIENPTEAAQINVKLAVRHLPLSSLFLYLHRNRDCLKHFTTKELKEGLLSCAIVNQDPRVYLYLCSLKAFAKLAKKYVTNTLIRAVSRQTLTIELLHSLIEKGANIRALPFRCFHGYFSNTRVLQAILNYPVAGEETYFQYSVRRGRVPAIYLTRFETIGAVMLVDEEVNKADDLGRNTPMRKIRELTVAQLDEMIHRGLDLRHKDGFGSRLMDYCKRHGRGDLIRYLSKLRGRKTPR
ncbi:MAG: type III secretion system effector protein [Simkaniaceae bacterium]|nr:type III secretion system effector protein [Simkaniaceae bacterium]